MPKLIAREGNLLVVDFGGQERPIDKKALATALGRSTRWVELRSKEGMPSTIKNHKRYFVLSECRTWITEHEQEAVNA